MITTPKLVESFLNYKSLRLNFQILKLLLKNRKDLLQQHS